MRKQITSRKDDGKLLKRKIKWKNRTILLLILAFLAAYMGVAASATGETKRHNWYFKNASDGKQPLVFDGLTFPDKYGSLYLGSPDEKVVYLTFDAGYENGNVEKILDALKKHSAPGAFFILPALIKNNTDLVKRMGDEGHLVCNHSYTHHDMSAVTSIDVLRDEIESLERVYTEYTGREMAKYFRPPEGSFSELTLSFCQQLGYRPTFWSFAYADWDNAKQKDPAWAKEKILSNLHNGMVLLLHPTSATNAAILDEVLTEIEARGYRFGTLDEMAQYQDSKKQEQASKIDYYMENGLVFCENRDALKCVALTFDDGPHPRQTEEILDVLGQYGVRATFFMIGKNIEEHPDIVQRILDEGHEIGNHTYSHVKVSALPAEKLREEITHVETILKEKFNYTPTIFRPPGGDICDHAVQTINDMGYRYVLWSWRLDTRDWSAPSVRSVVNVVEKNLGDGNVILFHDYVVGKSPTADALRILLPKMQERGYRFLTVSELADM